jgi:S1-C subfamily serine protease
MHPMTAGELNAVAKSCVGLDVPDGAGSGSVIAHIKSNTYVLTCAHVVGFAGRKVKCLYRVKTKFFTAEGTVERVDREMDLAIVRLNQRIDSPALTISEEEPALYSRVVTLGCPDGMFATVSEGILTGRDGSNRDTSKAFQLSNVFAAGGSSGGAVVDIDGNLIGVVTSVKRDDRKDYDGIVFAASLHDVKTFLRRDEAVRSLTKKRRTKETRKARMVG